METARIDKWLWSTRFFKTRSLATDACKNNQIKVNETKAKASKEIKHGDLIEIKKTALQIKVRVSSLISKRVSPTLAKECFEDLTPIAEYEKARTKLKSVKVQPHHPKGRPSKKQRRDLEAFLFSEDQ